jgi:hypothetical protein
MAEAKVSTACSPVLRLECNVLGERGSLFRVGRKLDRKMFSKLAADHHRRADHAQGVRLLGGGRGPGHRRAGRHSGVNVKKLLSAVINEFL